MKFFEGLKKFFKGLLKITHLSEYSNRPEFISIINTIFLIFSCGLIVSGYTSKIPNIFTKIWAAIVLVTIDITMQWDLGLAIAHWKAKYIKWHYFKAIILIIFWLWYMIGFATPTAVGFFVNTFNNQKQKIATIDKSHKRYEDTYNDNKTMLTNYKTQYQQELERYGTRSKELTTKIENLQSEQKTLQFTLDNLEKDQQIVKESYDDSLKNIAKVTMKVNKMFDENFLLYFAYISVVIMIYLFLALTAWKVEIRITTVSHDNIDDFKKDVLTWLDAAFDGRNNDALNGVSTISEKTGFSIDKCIDIRDFLAKEKVNGGMAVTVDRGFCKANHDKKFIRDYILSH